MGDEESPVPPFVIPKVPVMSDARLTSAVATVPAVAFKNPVSEASLKFEVKRLVDDAVVANELVVVAEVVVLLVAMRFGKVLLEVDVAVKLVPVIAPAFVSAKPPPSMAEVHGV